MRKRDATAMMLRLRCVRHGRCSSRTTDHIHPYKHVPGPCTGLPCSLIATALTHSGIHVVKSRWYPLILCNCWRTSLRHCWCSVVLWNSLPTDIVACDTLPAFRRELKTFLRQFYPDILLYFLQRVSIACYAERLCHTLVSCQKSKTTPATIMRCSLQDSHMTLQGAPIKNNPLGKIRYLWNCCRFFRQIYITYRGGFKPHMLRISLQKLM